MYIFWFLLHTTPSLPQYEWIRYRVFAPQSLPLHQRMSHVAHGAPCTKLQCVAVELQCVAVCYMELHDMTQSSMCDMTQVCLRLKVFLFINEYNILCLYSFMERHGRIQYRLLVFIHEEQKKSKTWSVTRTLSNIMCLHRGWSIRFFLACTEAAHISRLSHEWVMSRMNSKLPPHMM